MVVQNYKMSLICSVCSAVITERSNLNWHYRNVHNIIFSKDMYDINAFKNKCLDGCHCSFKTLNNLRDHLKNIHNINMIKEYLEFGAFKDFIVWLRNMRKANVRYFISGRSRNKFEDFEKIYMYCNPGDTVGSKGKTSELNSFRSQPTSPESTVTLDIFTGRESLHQLSVSLRIHSSNTREKRKLKHPKKGFCKLKPACTSSIIVTKMKSGRCLVNFIKTHYKHVTKIHNLRIPELGVDLAQEISSGVVVSSALPKEDVNSVKPSFKIDVINGVQHENDAVSVDLWIEDYKESSFIYYKKQGDDHPLLNNEDFCLIFMIPSQEILLKTYRHNIIYIDSTCGLNNFNFVLTTIMVLDEFGEGLPGACMFSNRRDTVINELFFQKIREKVGILCPTILMTDITPAFYDTWRKVMGTVKNSLFCSWHVDCAWKNNLNKITNPEKKQNVYTTLKYLQYLLDDEKFMCELRHTANSLCADDETKRFGDYFRCYFLNNSEQWAYCFRKNCSISVNMSLESMHKVVKCYLGEKKIKRLDEALHSVMSFIRDKIIEKLINMTIGKNCSHIIEIDKHHHMAENSHFDVTISENTWLLSSENSGSYIVSKLINNACCQLFCALCCVCVHTYKCTCTDYFIKPTICKHIHFIVLNNQKAMKTENLTVTEGNMKLELNEKINVHSNTMGSIDSLDKSDDVSISEIQEIKDTCSKIKDFCFEGVNKNQLSCVKNSLKSAYNLLCAITDTKRKLSQEEVNSTEEPSNKKQISVDIENGVQNESFISIEHNYTQQ